MTWLGRLLRREQLEKQVNAELQFDYEQRIAEKLRQGMSASEASRVVRMEFGDVELIREECRDVRGLQFLDSLRQDIRYALRGMRRSPGFTAIAVAILAIGIGVNTTVFSVTSSVLFGGFPLVQRNDRIVYITTGVGCCVSWTDFRDWRMQARSFEDMALVRGVPAILGDPEGFPEKHDATQVTYNTFRLTGQRPILGRDFQPSDEAPGAMPVAILSYSFWASRYAKNPDIVSQTIRINQIPTAVIGVMPSGFTFPQNQDLWLPFVPTAETRKRENRDTWFVCARMARGVTIETARAEMETIGRRLGAAYPLTNQGRNLLPHVLTFQDFFIGPDAVTTYWVMLGAVGFVLLIACANLANLLLARAIGRAHEISVRIALGAGRWRVIRQLLIESVMLSGLGGLLGWWLAVLALRVYSVTVGGAGVSDQIFGGSWFDNVLDYSMDYRAFVYLAAISVATGVLFGAAPARQLSKLDVSATLKDGGRGGIGGRRTFLPGLLVTAEMALALVLLAGAGVMVRSFLKLDSANLGIQTENLLTARLEVPATRYPSPESETTFFRQLTTSLEALPGVTSSAMGDAIPTTQTSNLLFELADSPASGEQQRPAVAALTVSPVWFRTLGANMTSGRDFNKGDGPQSIPVAIVNQRFAAAHWRNESSIGKRLRLFKSKVPGPWLTVVGVAPNIMQNGVARFDPLIYLPYSQAPVRAMWVVTRTQIPPGGLAAGFRRAVHSIDPDMTIAVSPSTMAENLSHRYRYKGVSGALFVIFAAIALVLAATGLSAVMAHSVSRRTQEIGVRIAIGATPTNILGGIFRQGMVPVAIGLGVGLAASTAVNQVLKSVLVQVSPTDPLSFVGASAALISAAIFGCLIPARAAMRVDPITALRQE